MPLRSDIGGRSRAATRIGTPITQGGITLSPGNAATGFTWVSYDVAWQDLAANICDPGTGGSITGRYRLWPGQQIDMLAVRIVFGTTPDLGDPDSAWLFPFPQIPETDLYWHLAWDDGLTPTEDDKEPDGWGGTAGIFGPPGTFHFPENLIYAGWPVPAYVIQSGDDIPAFGISGYGIEMSNGILNWCENFPFDGDDGNDLEDGFVLRASVAGRFVRQTITGGS